VVPRALQEQEQPVRPGGLAIWSKKKKGVWREKKQKRQKRQKRQKEAEEEKTERRRSSNMCRVAVQSPAP
jgi:hypothetical protein